MRISVKVQLLHGREELTFFKPEVGLHEGGDARQVPIELRRARRSFHGRRPGSAGANNGSGKGTGYASESS